MGENKFSIIFDLLKADILAGKFAGGRPLPSAPALMRRFGVARATAVAALRELVRCGFAVSRRGKGTFSTERTVGLILPGVAYSEIFLPVMSGLSRRCQDAGYGLLFGDAYSNDPVNRAAQAKALAEDFAHKRVSGVIFQPVSLLDNGQELNAERMNDFGTFGNFAPVFGDVRWHGAVTVAEKALVAARQIEAILRQGYKTFCYFCLSPDTAPVLELLAQGPLIR